MSYTVEISKTISLTAAMEAQNICTLLDEDDVKRIGICVAQGYAEDKQSRIEWEERTAKAMKLALQVAEQKTFPWPNAANVKFPLITVAALQYHALAYPALISGTDIVKCRVIGEDPTGEKAARSYRVSTHMSWQCLEQDEKWEEEHDKLLLVQGIVGCAFVKKVWDPICAHNISCLVHPKDFIINYYTKDLCESPRYTHVFVLSNNAIEVRERDGRFTELELPQTQPGATTGNTLITEAMNEREGVRPPPQSATTPYETGEQYCWLDLDGDEYCEPYIVTFDIGTSRVRSIVARFLPAGVKYSTGETLAKYARVTRDGIEYDIPNGAELYEIEPVEIFTKYGFIPAPDGGFYDLGLGMLLGPLNESVNTALNQIFDAGTMATLGGGFVGRGFKGRGGPFSMRPFEWYPVDAPGDDLRKNVLPLPIREPSNVLFQVLGLLIQYAERVAGSTEIQMGENPGQNTPAETTRTLNQNGMRVSNGIYKRTWRSMRDEFRIQYDLNKLYFTHDEDYEDLTTGKGAIVRKDDYSGTNLDVKPAADPHIVSETERVNTAMMIAKNSLTVPGHNRYQSFKRMYRAMQVSNIDEIMPPPMQQGPNGQPVPAQDFPAPPDPKMMKVQIDQGELQLKMQQFQSDQMEMKADLQLRIQEAVAKINNLDAQATLFAAQAKSEETEPIIKLIYAQIESVNAHKNWLVDMLSVVNERLKNSGDTKSGGARRGVEAAPVNPAISGALAGIGGGGNGAMAGGGLPIQ